VPGPDVAAPKKSKAGAVVGIAIGLVAAVAAFFGVRMVLGGGEPSLDAFAAGDAVSFSEPSGRFAVDLPTDPEERRQSVPLPNGGQVETVVYYVDNEPEYVFLASYTDLGTQPFSLDGAAQGAAAAAGGTITSQAPRTAGGVNGTEVRMSVAGTTATMWMGVSGSTLYQLQAIGVPDGHPGISRFFDSFRPAA
jgi:hypothetical protein